MTSMMLALAVVISPPMGIYTPGVSSGPNVANLEKVGQKALTLRDGKHHIVVTLTVAAMPREWPEAFVVGPTSNDHEMPKRDYRIVTKADILVDGCPIDQPWPAIQGMSMPSGAVLYAAKGHWGLEIDGPGDGAEDYNVRFAFDKRRVLTRVLRWGPDYFETTRYDIQVDPDLVPQECS